MSTPKEILMPMLQELIDTEFRYGFEDSVLQRCCGALRDAGLDKDADHLWNNHCCGRYIESCWGDQELLDKLREAKNESAKEGCFVMPSWGTYGT